MFDTKKELEAIKERMVSAGVSEDEANSLIIPLMDELERRVCGLVWEHKDSSIPKMNSLPAFIRQEAECITGKEGTDNILIEGENLYALMGLQYTHIDESGKGMVDIIYIDPPYNTESTDFAYNDKFEKSEWLSLMEIRLKLGRNLLNDTGIIFISINDKFHAHLKLLCDDVFGASNFLADMIWRSTPGSNTGMDIKKVTEYVLCYEKCQGKASTGVIKSINEGSYTNEDEYVKRRGKYKTNKLDRRMTGKHYSEALNYPIKMPDGTMLYPGCEEKKQNNWNWRWSAKKVEWGKKNGFIIFNQDVKTQKWSIYFKQYLNVDNTDTKIERYQSYQNLIENVEGTSSSRGADDLMRVVKDKVFDYPKPLNLIKHLLGIHTNPNALVLDFFAGSGTTGQAVLEMNDDNNWHRKFILCTNNEVRRVTKEVLMKSGVVENSPEWEKNGICRSVTLPRLMTVITGIRPDGSIYERKDNSMLDLLFEKKVSFDDLKPGKSKSLLEKVEEVYRDSVDDYDSITNVLQNNYIRVYGATKFKDIKSHTSANLYYYRIDDSPIDCATEEETIMEIIKKFVSYVSLKENAFELSEEESWTILKDRQENEVLVVTDTNLTLRDIKKAMGKCFSDNCLNKKVYCKVNKRESQDGIELIPYPKEIMNILVSRRKDIIKGELR